MRVYNQFPEESVFTRLYNLLKQRKQARNKFIITVVQQLDPMKPQDPKVFEFLSAVLANCQLQVNEELQLITSYLSQKIDAQTAIFKQKLKQLIKNEDQEKVFEEVQEASLICILLTLRKYLFMLYSYGGYDAETKTYPSDKQLIKNHELQQSFISLCENIQQYYHKQTLQDREIVELKDIIKELGKIDIEQLQVFMSKVKRPRRGENLSGKKGANPQKKQETQQKKKEMEILNNQESSEGELVITEQIQQKQKGKISKQNQSQKQVQVKDKEKEKEKQSQNRSQKNDKQQGVKNSEEVIVLE